MSRRGWHRMLNDFSREPTQGYQHWLVGLLVAGALAVYGLFCSIVGRGWLPGLRRVRWIELVGVDAIFLGIACLGAAAALHAHFFWGEHPEYHGYASLGKIAGLVAVVGGFAAIFYRFFLSLA